MWQRIRWGNVGRLCAAIAVVALVVAWPRLASPPPRVGGDEPIAVGPDKTPTRPRAKARAKGTPAKPRGRGKPAQPPGRAARRDATLAVGRDDARVAKRPKRPVLGGGMVDARPVAGAEPAGGSNAPSGGGDAAPTGDGGGDQTTTAGGEAGGAAGVSPPPAPPDPAAAEFGPEG